MAERYGGRGLTQKEQVLFRAEFAYRRIGVCNANGLDMLSPILFNYGTEEQKDQHLVKIARMEEMWCQGFSEPENGSDLTHLRTTAIRDGDEYIVNGSKVWTGHAMHADWMVLLCRTNPEEKGSRGLSMLMVDLHNTPGVEIQPIRHMTGGVMFCQEYFTDARVPVENLVGPKTGGGWPPPPSLSTNGRSSVGLGWRRSGDCSTTPWPWSPSGVACGTRWPSRSARWSSRWRRPRPWSMTAPPTSAGVRGIRRA